MDLSILDKSSEVTPLLVQLYDSHKLYSLAKDKKPVARAELTRAVSELLSMDLNPRESELIADVLIELMRQAEIDLREAVSEHLSRLDNVPLRLVLQMANDNESVVAAPVLKNSPVLGELDLIYIIKAKNSAYWQSIAARNTLTDQVINILADTKDLDTAVALAENMNIRLTDHSVLVLSDLAQDSEVLARPLLRRDEVADDIASRLYKYVGQELKRYILQNYEIDSGLVTDVIDDVVDELAVEFRDRKDDSYLPSAPMLRTAQRFKDKGMLTVPLMMGTLRRAQYQSFIAQFSKFTDLEPDVVEEILKQPNGQGLAVACKAFDIEKQDFLSFYLLTNSIRNKGKMADLQDMSRAVAYYNRIEPRIARNIVNNSAGQEIQEQDN